MNIKEQVSKLKEMYGIMVVETEDGTFELKPSVDFYEKFMLMVSAGDREAFTKFLIDEINKMVVKDLGLTEEEARLFVLNYLEEILVVLEKKLEKKQRRQIKN